MKLSSKYRLISLFIFLFTFFLSGSLVFAETDIYGGAITEDTTWTKDGSPYVIYAPVEGDSSLTVNTDVTLTIEAGVVVKFDYGQSMSILGKLVTRGTSEEKVYFTSLYDDSVGGDTNLDDGIIIPYHTDWAGIQIMGGITELLYTNISYAENALTYDSSVGEISNLDIVNSQNGINAVFGSTVKIENSTIENIFGDALFLYQDSTVDSKFLTLNAISGDAANIFYNSTLFFADAIMKNIAGQLVYMYSESTTSLKHSNLENVSDGITFYNNSTLNITDSEIKNVAGYPFIEFYNGSHLSFTNSSLQDISGTAIGTYGVDWSGYSTTTLNISSSTLLHGDGIGLQTYGNMMEVSISKSKIQNFAEDGIQAFSYPSMSITDSDFSENNNGITSWGSYITIGNSVIENNLSYGIYNNPAISGAPEILAINNWWGDASGPFNADTNASGTGNQISFNIQSQPWLRLDPRIPKRVPVIIVPGLLGTELKDDSGLLWFDLGKIFFDIGDNFLNALFFSPDLKPVSDVQTLDIITKKDISNLTVFDYSNKLINEFNKVGYIQGTSSDATLFTFPYDWRYGVTGLMSDGSTTMSLLKNKIQEVLDLTGSEKVDIIAHSTGGLIVKKYVIDNLDDHHINKMVFVGVPNTGAPKAIQSLIQGDNAGIPWLSSKEMKKISLNLPVIYDLLPSQQYYNIKGSYIKIVNEEFLSDTVTNNLSYDETHDFLINDHLLNSTALTNAKSLHTQYFDDFDLRTAGIDLYSVNGCKAGTLGKVTEVRHIGYGGIKSTWYEKPEEVPGDGTVPLESSTNLPIDQSHKYYALKASHAEMMSQDGIKDLITDIISESDLNISDTLITQDISKCKLNGKAISVFSPLDIDVVDQDGNHSGLTPNGDIVNDIPNADIQVWDDHKFVYLPTDEGQIYVVNINGIGVGTYTIESDTISDGVEIKTDIFSNLPVTEELIGSIDISSDTTLLYIKQTPSSPLETIIPDSPEIQSMKPTIINAGSAIFLQNTPNKLAIAKEVNHVSTTSIKKTTTISSSTKKLSSIVLKKKTIKSLETQVASVILADSDSKIYLYIKDLIKKLLFFWRK